LKSGRKPIRDVFRSAVLSGNKAFGTNLRLAKIFAAEGVLFSLIITICNNNNNLFAARLGADSYQLGLLSSLPPIVGLIFLIPFAIITDRLRNKRNMVIIASLGLGVTYVLVGCVAFLSTNRIVPLIIMLIIVNFPMTLYNSSWQAFFSDVVRPEDRNEVYAHRTRMNTAVGIVFPLLFGAILTAATGTGKIAVHQVYYFLALPFSLGQMFLLRKVHSDVDHASPKLKLSVLGQTAKSLFKNTHFRGFLAVALLVYMGWQMDWSLYFQAQLNYLHMNESQMSLIVVLCAITQFIMLGYWSRLAATKGIRFVFMIGAGGFAFCCLSLVISLMLPPPVNVLFYYVFQSMGSAAFSAFQLSTLLCLLEVIPPQNKTLSIALYSTFILFSNIIMPYFGVLIYNLIGGDRQAMIITMLIVASIRITATAAAFIRWHINKGAEITVV
jgi:MFS family permease